MARFRRNPEQSPDRELQAPDRIDASKESGDEHSPIRRDQSPKNSPPIILDAAKTRKLQKNQYWLTRIVFLRSLGFVYAVAFLVALNQNKYLLGEKGLLPASLYMERVRHMHKGFHFETLLRVPTLMWFYKFVDPDTLLDGMASVGFVLALGVTVTGAANAVAFLLLWILYHSVVNVGQLWLGVPASGDRLPGNFLLPHLDLEAAPTGHASVARGRLGLPLAAVPDHAWRWLDQNTRRQMLAGFDLHDVPL